MKTLTIATRKSPLALAQTRAWIHQLRGYHADLDIVELQITTTGDRIFDRALNDIGGKGLFIKEIEQALLDEKADIAVHSMKDVPPALAPSLVIGCVPERADARDVLSSPSGTTLHELPPGARVGTTSLRRQVQLRALRPDLVFLPMRGNVETRLRRCEAGEVDAVVLAQAGLQRLGQSARITQVFSPDQCVPAVGQGALAIEVRDSDTRVRDLVEPLTDAEAWLCTSAERGVMTAVQGSCQIPVGAYACRAGDELWLRAMLADSDGSNVRRAEVRHAFPRGPQQAAALGMELGGRLRSKSECG